MYNNNILRIIRGDNMYTQIYTKSVYTLLKSSLRIEEYVKKAKQYGMKSIALTDEENVYGLIKFYQACIKYDIKPLLGITIFINNTPLILLAKTNIGYKKILRIVSYIQTNKENITLKELSEYKNDLLCIIPTNNPRYDKLIISLKEIFAEDLYLSVFPELSESIKVNNKKVYEVGQELNINLIGINEVK